MKQKDNTYSFREQSFKVLDKPGRFRIVILLFILLSDPVGAQFQRDHYIHRNFSGTTPKKLLLGIRATGFFNNNEFFGTDTEGYTLTGNYFQPVLNYSFTTELSLTAGVHLMKYHGREEFAQVQPFFSANYNPSEKLQVKLGSFNKGSILNLPEPLYNLENTFHSITGSGVMILYSGDVWGSVNWLDWKDFIEPGDPFRERFIFGHSGHFNLINTENHRLRLPYYVISEHKGGQINISDEPVETRFDLGGGAEWKYRINSQIFNSFLVKADMYFEEAALDAANGKAFYGYGELSGKLFSLGAGYFRESKWQSILGQPLFFSREDSYYEAAQEKQFVIFKAGIGKKITAHSSFMVRFEGYYQTGINRLQYSYGLHIFIDEWVQLFSPEGKTAMVY